MTTPMAPPPRPRDDDDDWAQALAGRSPPASDPATVAEAALLRDALRHWPAVAPVAALDGGEARDFARLLAEARRRGLLRHRPAWFSGWPPAWCAGCAERWRAWGPAQGARGAWAGLALAGVLGLAVLPTLWQSGDEAPTLRNSQAVLQVRAADPRAERDRWAEQLAAAGADVQRYERAGRWGLDAELPAARGAALEQWLAARGVQPAADGSVRVEFSVPVP